MDDVYDADAAVVDVGDAAGVDDVDAAARIEAGVDVGVDSSSVCDQIGLWCFCLRVYENEPHHHTHRDWKVQHSNGG